MHEPIDAEFTVVRSARPKGTERWPEATFQRWVDLPWWRRYKLTLNKGWWIIALASAALAFHGSWPK
jgi:hypothetical protein